jgi:hypothetical protein
MTILPPQRVLRYSYNYLLTLPSSRSSHAPVGFFYFTALADGGQLSAFFSLCCPVYAKWAGLF